MNTYEKEYYESESFWQGEMLQDDWSKQRIIQTAALIPEDVKSLIDVGCGNGVFVNFLKGSRPDLQLTACDRSQTALQFVQVNKTEADITHLPFADNSFDCVSCLEVIEHLPEDMYQKALAELLRVSRKYIIISVPYKEDLNNNMNRCPACGIAFNYDLHLRRFTSATLKTLFGNAAQCTNTQLMGEMKFVIGKRILDKMARRLKPLPWKSPLCPYCGYTSEEAKPEPSSNTVTKELIESSGSGSFYKTVRKIVAKIIPKETRYYWKAGVYEKTTVRKSE